MPPRFKFTKEQIISVALSLARKQGLSAVTARAIGCELDSSSKVIFSLFEDMEEVRQGVVEAAKNIYRQYIAKGLADPLPFRGVGAQYIRFATEEPKLFQLLFMQEAAFVPDLQEVLQLIDDSYEKILQSVQDNYGFSQEISKEIYTHMWIYSHGIAVLIATKVCNFSSEQIKQMMSQVFRGIVAEYGGTQ